jgi:hypothetical protein
MTHKCSEINREKERERERERETKRGRALGKYFELLSFNRNVAREIINISN